MTPYNFPVPKKKVLLTADDIAEDPAVVERLTSVAENGGGSVFLADVAPEAEIERIGYRAVWEAIRRRLPAGWTLSDSMTGASYYKYLNPPDATSAA